MAIGIIATIKVQAGKAEEAEKAFNDLAKQVNANEEGCLFYACFKSGGNEYTFLESYKDEEALTSHGQSEYFKAAGKTMGAFVAGPPDIKRMASV